MLNRRRFLSIAAQGSGLLTLSVCLPAGVRAMAKPDDTGPDSFQSLFVSIHANNHIVFNLSKQEMGQGITTGYAMIFADELGADLEHMEVVNADYSKSFSLAMQGITGGSSSIPIAWQPLREIAAEVRMRLINAAGRYWKESPAGYTTQYSYVIDVAGNRRVAFGTLIPLVSGEEKVVPRLRDTAEFRYIGKAMPNIRTAAVTTGRLRYGMDIMLPEMLYASIERCPVYLGKAASIDDSEARKISGVVDVYHIKGFLGDAVSEGMSPSYAYTVQDGVAVIASNSWAALQGRKTLKIQWDGGTHDNASDASIAQSLTKAEAETGRHLLGELVSDDGSHQPLLRDQARSGTSSIRTRYDVAFQAHALMEPLNTVCHVTDKSCEVWSGHQFPRRIVEQLSPLLSLSPEQITVHVLPSGGGFGRRWEADFAVEAALLSKHMRRPVKCQWTREDEIRHDYYHAYERHLEEVTTDNTGNVVSWHGKRITFASVWNDDTWNPYADSVASRSLSLVELESPVQTGPWRSVSPHRNTFSRECTVDRIAKALGKDPLAFRLAWLRKDPIPLANEKDPQAWIQRSREQRAPLIRVLEEAKKYWPTDSKGAGIAITTMSSTCAHIAHVELINDRPKLNAVDVIVYCGTVINPSLVKGQFEGSVIWALQAVLYGGVHLKDGRVVQSNFHDYKMVRMPEAPEIRVHIIESNDAPLGTGEPGVPPLAPAMANAIYSLSGKQPTSIPFSWV